jgi:hypothetical protein
MLSKILAVVLAVTVLSVGGYAYWQYTNDTPATPTEEQTTSGCKTVPPAPCCLEPSRASCVSVEGCCSEKDTGTPSEVLAIEPREVK